MAKTQTDRAVIDLVINGQQAKTSLKEVSLEVTRTRSALNKMKETDAGYKDKLRDMHALVDAQRTMTARINDTSTAWGRFRKEAGTVMTGVLGGNIATAGLQFLAGLIPGTIEKTMKLKDAFADIEKATGLSAKGVENLNKELKAIDTRTTNQELRDIAVAGGQLGVANKELVEFVKNTDMAVVALGDEFTGGVDQVAKEIGGIGKLFKETRDQSIGASINQIGSALNELGAAGAATSPVVAEFTTRMGQLGSLAPKLAETLGLGAALQELGLTAEIAASGLSGLMLTAANRSDLFAQHLGMSKEALEKLINTDPNGFLMKLAKSFEGMAPVQVAQRLKELKVESQESIKVMSLLADQTDFVTKKQDLAAKSMAEGTSLTDEFNKKNHELARDLKELNEWFNSLLSSPGLQQFLVGAIHNTVEFIKVLPQMGQWLSKNSEWLNTVAIPSLILYNATLIKATASAVANTVAEGYRKVAFEVGFRWMMLMETASKAYALTTGVLTGQITLQTAVVTVARSAWAAFSAVLTANPLGAVAVAMMAVVAAAKYFSEHTQRALDLERKKDSLQKQSVLNTQLSARALQDLNEKVAHANELSQREQDNLKKTIALKQLETRARLSAALARAREIARQEADPTFWQGMKQGASDFVTGNWGNLGGAGLEQQKKLQTEANKAAAYAEAKNLAQVDQLQADLAQFDKLSQQMNRKPVTIDSGGTMSTITDPDEKKRKSDKAKKDALREEEQLDKLIADARQDALKAEQSDYDKAVFAFAEKYTKMYELAKDNTDKIKEIERLSLIEMAAIQKAADEKEDERRRKEQEKENKEGFDAALSAAQTTHTDSIGGFERSQAAAPTAIGDAEVQMQKLQADQTYLTHKLLLEQTFAQQSADTQRELTENWNAQVKLRADTDHQYTEQMKQAEWALQDAKRQAMTQGLSVLTGFLSKGTIAYKAAIVAQKAFAIAQVIVDTQREIAQIYANPTWSLMPDGGLGLKTAAATGAKIRAGIGIATIAAQGIQELAAKKDGGYTGLSELYGNPSGFVNGPTLFNQGRRSYIAGEAGREFVISNKALQNPVVADFARIMDVAQKSGNYGMLSAGAAAGGSTATGSGMTSGRDTSSDSLMVVAAIGRLEQRMAELSTRPISFDLLALERKQQEIEFVREATKG